jgi:hypothetical protein
VPIPPAGIKAKLVGHAHECGQGVGVHLLHDLAPVSLDRNLTNAELAADLLVEQASGNEHHDLAFATAERITLATISLARFSLNRSIASASSTSRPRTRSSTSRAFRGAIRANLRFA